jgi:hypothetical protein
VCIVAVAGNAVYSAACIAFMATLPKCDPTARNVDGSIIALACVMFRSVNQLIKLINNSFFIYII